MAYNTGQPGGEIRMSLGKDGADFVTGLLGWVVQLIVDLATGKKSVDEAREAASKGYQVTETDSDTELKHWK